MRLFRRKDTTQNDDLPLFKTGEEIKDFLTQHQRMVSITYDVYLKDPIVVNEQKRRLINISRFGKTKLVRAKLLISAEEDLQEQHCIVRETFYPGPLDHVIRISCENEDFIVPWSSIHYVKKNEQAVNKEGDEDYIRRVFLKNGIIR